ncbi:hypothetical protein [Microbulbifer yueqingensis]|uniref:PD-(D/E)XK nuclease superfamily protein n=1 Tax=Microbulbifer yueqingensis TaxID=658219 RepID=A0A1G9DFC2_9GAMM|nr:hypothetical protein [Microbulbifer yueqingensis]SDK62543.1 hypothetical protein SAMN05216212_2778 [Microbulbifer yueqingensis]
MRNIFDQYSQPENRLTHAVLTALDQDHILLKSFFSLIGINPPCRVSQLEIEEQTIVGQPEEAESESDRKGIPDGWIHNGEDWCLLIESKITSRLASDQLKRHRRTAERCGFEKIYVLAIESVPVETFSSENIYRLRWSDIYQLLIRRNDSPWASMAAEYFVIAEQKFSEMGYLKEGNLTVFTGIPFDEDRPFNYLEAKRILKLIMDELREDLAFCRDARINPDLPGRGAITGSKGSAVWDFLAHEDAVEGENFTKTPHFTVGINHQRLNVSITIPHRIKAQYKSALKSLTYDEFYDIVAEVAGNMVPLATGDPGFSPWCIAVQRRYPSQRSVPIHDAVLEFDLRTAIPNKSAKVKPQEQWLNAVYEAYINKRSNYQIQIGAGIYFSRSNKVKSKAVLATIKETFVACRPFLDALEDWI